MKSLSNKRFVIGDIHGAYLALVQVLERCGFDYENDELITIGDIVDGWADSYMCVEELLKIKNRIDIRGNHDFWFQEFLETTVHSERWGKGSLSTAKSYAKAAGIELLVHKRTNRHFEETDGFTINLNSGDIPESHKRFFRQQNNYYKDTDNNLFVHGGINLTMPLKDTLPYIMMWDRHLWSRALQVKDTSMTLIYCEDFNQIFIGHTAVRGGTEPIKADKIWNVDTGAGGGGKLTIMDVDTNEYFQSDLVPDLYPDDEHNKKNW
tara:strand:- start:5358 stop:6152 length:795 start_codon:yes stop_codon:yes gene_type:complete